MLRSFNCHNAYNIANKQEYKALLSIPHMNFSEINLLKSKVLEIILSEPLAVIHDTPLFRIPRCPG